MEPMLTIFSNRESVVIRFVRVLRRMLRTPDEPVLSVIRVVLGTVMFAHGAQKALGWFGGSGFQATLEFFGQKLGIPAPLAVLAVGAEFLGGVGLILGLFSRLCALGVTVNMIVAALLVHIHNGFFMNWFGTKAGEGVEYHLLAISLSLAILMRGAGALSLDRLLHGMIADDDATHGSLEPLGAWPGVPVSGQVFRVASLRTRARYWRWSA